MADPIVVGDERALEPKAKSPRSKSKGTRTKSTRTKSAASESRKPSGHLVVTKVVHDLLAGNLNDEGRRREAQAELAKQLPDTATGAKEAKS